MLTLAATSVVGTFIPQNENPRAYFEAYGEVLYRLFYAFGIFDMYHSWWFQFLLLVLTVNIVVCSIDRLSATWKIIFVKHPSFSISRARNFPYKEEFTVNSASEHLKAAYESFTARNYRHCKTEQTDSGFCIFAEKGRWTRLGVYIVHISVILLLCGGLIGSIFGFEGFVNIPEGEAIDHFRLRKTGDVRPLGFEIQCDSFHVSFYNTGAPKEYRSGLTILENGKSVLQKDIIVNDPLQYKGINIFQSSYGTLPMSMENMKGKEIALNFTSKETGLSYTQKAVIGQEFDIPENLGKFTITDFKDSYMFMGQHDLGQAFIGKFTPAADGEDTEIVLPLRHPNFDKMRRGNFVVSVEDYPHRYYTGLQITKDPGVLVVYMGFVIMIVGFFITFFMSHETVCVEVETMESGKKHNIRVSGTANKNKISMGNRVKRIAQKLSGL